MHSKIAVIGGGASGICAAIFAARCGADTVICEKNDRIGKKLLVTGNGRCNLTNTGADVSHYHGKNPSFVKPALESFGAGDAVSFFEELGLLTKVEDEGRVYPYCDRAGTVSDVLRLELDRLGVNVLCGFDVSSIKKSGDMFTVYSYGGDKLTADAVIFSAGGKASPNLGGGSGYGILKSLGHTCTGLTPSIVQLRTDKRRISGLKGVKCIASVTFENITKKGDLLFTEYGVSGPPVFYISSYYNGTQAAELSVDFFPEIGEKELFKFMKHKTAVSNGLDTLFTGVLHKNIGAAILKYCGITSFSRSCAALSSKELSKICGACKDFRIPLEGKQSWNNAQVTSGGIPTSEVNSSTLESKICPGLYITGEILDIDGDCGGYNLQWAWSSGYTAGISAASKIMMKG